MKRFYTNVLGVADAASWTGNAGTYFDTAVDKGLSGHANGGIVAPAVNDILVFDGGRYGHVAIISAVTATNITLVEQNWSTTGTNTLALAVANGSYTVSARGTYTVLGWLRPSNRRPTGYLDGVDVSGRVFGWAKDPDDESKPVKVHVYIDKNAGTSGATPIEIVANQNRADVGQHAFNFDIPAQYRDGLQHQVWAWGIDLSDPANNNQQLAGSPKAFTLLPNSQQGPASFTEAFNNAPDYSNNWTKAFQSGSPTSSYTPGNFRIQAPAECTGPGSGTGLGFRSKIAFVGNIDVSVQLNHAGFGRTSFYIWSETLGQPVIGADLDTNDTAYLNFTAGANSTQYEFSSGPYMNRWITLRFQMTGGQVNFYADNGSGQQLLKTFPVPISSPSERYTVVFSAGSVCWKSGANDTSFRLIEIRGTIDTSARIFVANSASNSVSMINAATNSIIRNLTPLSSPETVSVSPDRSLVFVNSLTSVSVFQAATGILVATIPFSDSNGHSLVTPNGRELWVTNTQRNLVSIVDLGSYAVVATIPVGQRPWGISFSPDGSRAYVANSTSNSVTIINAANRTVLTTIATGAETTGVAVSPLGDFVYATNLSAGTVSAISTSTNSVVATTPVGTHPWGVAFTPDGKFAYIANGPSNNVSVISTATHTVSATIPIVADGSYDRLLAISQDGTRVYVTNYASNTLSVIDTSTNSQIATIPVGVGPIGVASSSSSGTTLLHRYTFQANANDVVGTANGSLIGGAIAGSGRLRLSAVGQYVQFAANIVPASGSYSVTLLAHEASAAGIAEFISQGFSGGPGFYLGYVTLPDSTRGLRATDTWQMTGVPFPADGLEHAYALVVDAGARESRLYVDGILRSTLPAAITTTNSGSGTRLGRQFDVPQPNQEYFTGTIADVRIYAGALTSQEVATIANSR